MAIIQIHLKPVLAAIRQITTVLQTRLTLHPDFQRTASPAIIQLHGSRLRLIMMENISLYIPEVTMQNGVIVQNAIRTVQILQYLVV